MVNYYKLDVIPIILDIFKVKDIVIGGLSDEKTLDYILDYCHNHDSNYISIDSKLDIRDNIQGSVLEVLPNLNNYGAVFLDDDPNWYTVYNELNIIKQNNNDFPLVFICNNYFPHARRDSYTNPNSIPQEFRNDYSENLMYNDISIHDGFYHAINNNTPKNGVLTAIEDFLFENQSIEVMNFKLLNGITILYPKNNITYFKLQKLSEKINNYVFEYEDVSDNFLENKLLIDYISKLHLSQDSINVIDELEMEINEKEKIISIFEDKTNIHDSEINYKNSQINGINSKLKLKESQLKNVESKLINKEYEIENLNNKIQNASNQINQLKEELDEKDKSLKINNEEFKNEISIVNSQIDLLREDISKKEKYELELKSKLKILNNHVKEKENQIKIKQNEINDKETALNSTKKQLTKNLSKLDEREYCVSCYEEKLQNNYIEIQYLKKNNLIKMILSPMEYLLLIFNSNFSDLPLNFKLYKSLKNSKCFDVGFYLNNNKDLQNSKFCKYFSPELHYVCKGFDEKRKFNKKYFNRNSKLELLDYINKCS